MDVIVLASGYKFNIDAVLEVVMLADFGGLRLPAGPEFVHKNHEVRIAHRDRNAAHFTEGELDGEFIAHLRFAHVSFEFKFHAVAANQGTGFDAGAGAHYHIVPVLLGGQIGGDAACAVAGNFGFRAIGVEEAGADIGVGGGKEPLHAIGSDALVAVTHAAADDGQVGAGVQAIHNEEVVAAGAGFDKRDGGRRSGFRNHSPSAWPRELTLRSRVDWRRRLSSDCCSWRAASTENCTRERPSILAIWIEVMLWCSSCRMRLSSATTVSALSPRTS